MEAGRISAVVGQDGRILASAIMQALTGMRYSSVDFTSDRFSITAPGGIGTAGSVTGNWQVSGILYGGKVSCNTFSLLGRDTYIDGSGYLRAR